MTDRELLKHVFNAWEDHWTSDLQSELLGEIRIRLLECERCGEKNPAEIHTCTPKREWQGLTDEEIQEGNRESWVTTQAWESAVWWAEKKLKEKNNG